MSDLTKAKERRWLLPLLSSLFIGFTAGVYAPLDTYFALAGEVCFPVTEFLPECLLLFAAIFAVCFGLSMLFRGAARNVLCALMIGGALALYIQGSFLNLDYGVMNGVLIDWNQYGHYGRINFIYWLVAILLPLACLLLLKKRFGGVMRFVCIFLTLTMALSLSLRAFMGEGKPQSVNYTFSPEQQFELSSQSNILVFVLDKLDTSSYTDYLENHPEAAAKLDGFTLFSNSVGYSTITKYALPVLLTNHGYDPSQDYQAYLDESWNDAELFQALQASGYESYVYTDSAFASANAEGLVSNLVKQHMVVRDHAEMIREFGMLALFRYAPHSIKKTLDVPAIALQDNKKGVDKPMYVVGDTAYFSAIKNGEIAATKSAPTFHLYHLRGAHDAYILNSDGTIADGQTIGLGNTLDAHTNALTSYLEQMKALGIYDSATIVITADHGNPKIDYQPVLLIKRPNEHGALRKSDALVSQFDLPATIAAAAGLDCEIQGSVDAYQSDRQEAEFRSFSLLELDRFYQTRYWVDEQGCLSYDETGKIFTKNGIVDREYSEYTLGEKFLFVVKQSALEWCADLCEGNIIRNYDVDYGLWFGKPDSQFKLRLTQKGSGPLKLTLGISGIIGERQRVQVMDEGKVLAEATVRRGDSEVVLELPESLRNKEPLSFTLRFPDASSELQRTGGVSGDTCQQALSLESFQLD